MDEKQFQLLFLARRTVEDTPRAALALERLSCLSDGAFDFEVHRDVKHLKLFSWTEFGKSTVHSWRRDLGLDAFAKKSDETNNLLLVPSELYDLFNDADPKATSILFLAVGYCLTHDWEHAAIFAQFLFNRTSPGATSQLDSAGRRGELAGQRIGEEELIMLQRLEPYEELVCEQLSPLNRVIAKDLFKGNAPREIAERLGLRLSTVQRRLRRIVKLLQQLMAKSRLH